MRLNSCAQAAWGKTCAAAARNAPPDRILASRQRACGSPVEKCSVTERKSGARWLKAPSLQPRHAVVALAVTIGVVLSAMVGSGLQREHDQTVEAARSKTRNLTRVLEEHARQSLGRVDLVLSRAADEIMKEGRIRSADPDALRRYLRTLLPVDGLIRALVILDRDGSIILSTFSENTQGLPAAADRDYFVAQRERAGLGVVIGAAARSRVTGTWTLPISHRLDAPGGVFQGVLLASVEPARLQRFYDSIDVGRNGFVTLFQRQGWIVVRSPFDERVLGRNWADSPMFRAHLPASEVNTLRQVVVADGVERIYSYRALQDFPVIVTLGLSLNEVLAPWRASALRDGIFLAIVLSVLAGATWALNQQLRRREAAQKELRRLSAIIESSTDLIAITRNDTHFVYMNPAARRWAGIGPEADVTPYTSDQFYAPDRWSFVEQVARPSAIRDGIWSGENRMRAPDGREIDVSRVLIAHRDASGRAEFFSGISRDITERKLREKLLTGERQVLEMIARNAPLDQILTDLMRLLESQAPGMLCSVLLLDADGLHLRHGAAPSLPEDYTAAVDGIAIGESVGSCGAAAHRREPVHVEDIATDPLWADYRELALRHGLRACWSTPIFDSERRVLGTFAMYYRQPARPAAQHEWLIGIATNIAAIAIIRHEADAALRNARLRLEIALEGSLVSVWETDLRANQTWLSAGWADHLGKPGAEMRTTPSELIALVHPEDRPRVASEVGRLVKGEIATYAVEYRVKTQVGGWKWLLGRGQVIERDAGGRTLRMSGTNTDITERKLAEEALQRQHERLNIAQDAARMIVVDWFIAEDRLEFSASPLWLRGPLPADRGAYPLFKDQVHPEDRALFLAARRRAIETLQGQRPEFRFVRTDGEVLWLRAHQAVVADAQGKATRLIAALYDITEQKRAEAQLVALNAELEAKVAARTDELAQALKSATTADRLKSEFMANVTHELRTPLHSVIGFADLLKDGVAGPLNARQAAFSADILASGQRLLALVEGILEMSRLDMAQAALEREPVQIGAVLQEWGAVYRMAADKRGLSLRLDVAPDVGVVALDPKALRRMLDALLDNAVRFNREGGAVSVSARRVGGQLEIAVIDTGIGIAEADLSRLFQPLVQLDAGLARQHGGVGLGLALARRLAELHGGTIDVQSKPGEGSRFTLRLPILEAP
jgi:PAS domain S-box-containing protein